MRKLLNTLYVTSPDSYVHRDGTNIVVEVSGKERGRLPIHNVQQVVCFGYAGLSPSLMQLCGENDVSLSILKPNGKFIASVNGPIKGNVILRREQYRIADDECRSVEISRNMIDGKLINCRTVLRKGLANHPDRGMDAVSEAIDRLTGSIASLGEASSLSDIRGIEGNAAKVYFNALDNLILRDKDNFYMHCRSRRPPKDRFNALLSFLYTLLSNDVRSALETNGLDPYVGFLHTDRPGRASLALDMMEEMRPIADRVALRLVNLGMVSADGFKEELGESFMMDDETRAVVIGEWQRTKGIETSHHFINESVSMGLIPHVQSLLLNRTIKCELDGYPPFIIKR